MHYVCSSMMKITGITAQTRNPGRVNVSVDGRYKLSLDIHQITDLGIKIGNEYSEEELLSIETESIFGKVYVKAIEYCMIRPHSSREIKEYLKRKTITSRYRSRRGELKTQEGISQLMADRVFERLVEKGYVDDEKFAKWWIESRSISKGSSIRKLDAELRAKGVDPNIITAELEKSSRNDKEEIYKVIAKKGKRYDDIKKLKAYLLRQGFTFEAINDALNDSEK